MNGELHCQHVAPLLPALADGELDSGRRAAVEAHLAVCPECRTLQSHVRRLTLAGFNPLSRRVFVPGALFRPGYNVAGGPG